MKKDLVNRLEKVLYTAKVHTTGGRAGMSRSSDGRLEVRLSRPGSPGAGTNPKQLFAAGWSACFESAMEFAARNPRSRFRLITPSTPRSISVPKRSAGGRLYVSLPGMRDGAAPLSRQPTVCPYSRATHGNIAVETTLV
jgi:Ohr subfamily peroxiredoxin